MTANPTLLTMPLAANGQKNVIPETQATAGDGLFSQSTGFPAETSLPLGAGGVAPSREDFNGLANLLGGVAFYAQKGFTFNYDATQDYYTGCVVIDGGNRYECIADMAAGTIAPSADTGNTYWQIFKGGLDADQIPAVNHRDVITTSGTYTAPVAGWYKITVKGGGGGGQTGFTGGQNGSRGASGGEGGTTIGFEYMTAGTTATVVIGAGGTGGSDSTAASAGTDGGNSSVTVNGNTYTGGGGGGGGYVIEGFYFNGGHGGSGTIQGASGSGCNSMYVGGGPGATGGGQGGGEGRFDSYGHTDGVNGGGGSGGAGTKGGLLPGNKNFSGGGAGGNGFAWFEYFDSSLNP